jgi:hypothetical protein
MGTGGSSQQSAPTTLSFEKESKQRKEKFFSPYRPFRSKKHTI